MFNKLLSLCFCTIATLQTSGQSLYFKDAIQENRDKFYARSIRQSIIDNLSKKLDASSEDEWISAFSAINLFQYHTAFVNKKIDSAARNMNARSNAFKRGLITLLYSDYNSKYAAQVRKVFLNSANDYKLLAIAANYLLKTASVSEANAIALIVDKKLKVAPENPILISLQYQLSLFGRPKARVDLSGLFESDYLKGNVLVFSFQRQNRNFPGIVLVRDTNGLLLRKEDGSIFSVGQLARSGSNMPGYISMGNTPQGIFRMYAFGVSKSYFIGPTPNVQLTLPFEEKPSHFFADSTITDSTWDISAYKKLLPESLRQNKGLLESFYAGQAGRNEIIAHGTTIDPEYYKASTFYPYTPTEGCLATKEIWDNITGNIKISEQLLLIEAIKKAGGAKGYLIVVEIDDNQRAVTTQEILSYFN